MAEHMLIVCACWHFIYLLILQAVVWSDVLVYGEPFAVLMYTVIVRVWSERSLL